MKYRSVCAYLWLMLLNKQSTDPEYFLSGCQVEFFGCHYFRIVCFVVYVPASTPRFSPAAYSSRNRCLELFTNYWLIYLTLKSTLVYLHILYTVVFVCSSVTWNCVILLLLFILSICRFCKVASLMGDSLFWQPATLSFFVVRCITVFVLFCGKWSSLSLSLSLSLQCQHSLTWRNIDAVRLLRNS